MEKIDFVKTRLEKHRKNRTLIDVAVASQVARRTLTNIMNGEGAQTKTVDKLYNYFKGAKK